MDPELIKQSLRNVIAADDLSNVKIKELAKDCLACVIELQADIQWLKYRLR